MIFFLRVQDFQITGVPRIGTSFRKVGSEREIRVRLTGKHSVKTLSQKNLRA
jgi:hypothetical protein